MSDDGADLNVKAEQGLRAVLGGEEPTPLSDDAFATMIRTAETWDSYDACANRAARLVLEYLEQHPQSAELTVLDLYPVVKAAASKQDQDNVFEGLSGFMWGWAVNAARHVLKLRPVPNPAIVTIDTDH